MTVVVLALSHKKFTVKDMSKVNIIKMKKEIGKKHQRWLPVADLARQYNWTTSKICTILKKRDKIIAATSAMGVFRLSKQCASDEAIEKLFLLWINKKQQRQVCVTDLA